MQLTVRDVSQFLSVPESTISRWIKQRGLPAEHVGGQYRFNRAELLEWATANHIKVAMDLFDNLEGGTDPVPGLAESLQVGGIHHGLQQPDKVRALRALVELLPLPDGIEREFLFRLFLAREASASTAIGDGIAIPHVRNPIVLHVSRPMISLCFLEPPIAFGALDGKPVHVLFSLVCPTTRSHLQMLARLTFALHDAQFKDVVMRHGQREEILQEARRIEAALAPPPAITR